MVSHMTRWKLFLFVACLIQALAVRGYSDDTVTVDTDTAKHVRLYPNPWRADRHAKKSITFDGLTPGSTIKIFTTAGQAVVSFKSSADTATWNQRNAAGGLVASGIYLYVVQPPHGEPVRGKFAIIR